MKKRVVIIGAGPAGLTAAFELANDDRFEIIVIEQSNQVGGISKTIEYKGNRIDIGGHRFFSKSQKVMDWWLDRLPISENGMLRRNRKSTILYDDNYFDYPLKLNWQSIKKLGIIKSIRIFYSYFLSLFKNSKKASNLEEFFISRFGKELYITFFKNYTEKVWGKPCTEISAEWGAQRIKNLSLLKAVMSIFKSKSEDIYQKKLSTSLIEEFLYPKYGPGMMWETVAEEAKSKGVKLLLEARVTNLSLKGKVINQIEIKQKDNTKVLEVDEVISSMPMKYLLKGLSGLVSPEATNVLKYLEYRDFIIVGLLFPKKEVNLKDNWIYLHDSKVVASRMQIFNNWSPYMVKEVENHLWVGLEYFCNQNDMLWKMNDDELLKLALKDFETCKLMSKTSFIDGTVIRMPKTYPSYTGVYEKFNLLRKEMEQFPNLYLIGRNGMHKYNNQDHSMLTAMSVADKIKKGDRDKSDVWEINTELDYQEEA